MPSDGLFLHSSLDNREYNTPAYYFAIMKVHLNWDLVQYRQNSLLTVTDSKIILNDSDAVLKY